MTKKEKEIPEISIKKCNSCIVCIEVCPVDCLVMSVAAAGIKKHKYPTLLNEDMCIGCSTCAVDCPVEAIKMVARAA
jgi:formate hydrogenlyase subunit 6/NADH:ubiquinone oxidoreductase subunit I